MSFEPTILIRRSDLEKNRSKIENKFYSLTSKVKQETIDAWVEMYKALNMEEKDVIKFKEIEIILIHPELTSHNKKVRDILDELEIDYEISN